jgi:phosphoglycerate dehydrogenase-like enzyme
MGSVLLLALAFRRHGAREAETLQRLGYEIVRSPYPRAMTQGELLAFLAAADAAAIEAVVAGADPFTDAVFARLPRLKVISRWGVGYDAIDLDAATRHGVLVANTPGLLGEAVADLAFGLMLALARKIPSADRLVRRGGWEELSGVSVWRRSLGLVGFGSAGQAMARRARGFDMTVRACDPAGDQQIAGRYGVRLTSLDEVLSESDFVSLHADLNDATRRMMDRDAFARMKRGAYLVNTARGGLVDEEALLEALGSGRLAGAALDAHAVEPPRPDSPLMGREDVILTPHIGFSTVESIHAVNAAVLENLLDGLSGRRPRSLVNPQVWKGGQ